MHAKFCFQKKVAKLFWTANLDPENYLYIETKILKRISHRFQAAQYTYVKVQYPPTKDSHFRSWC